MLSYVARRILEAVPSLIGISMLSFLLFHIVPGNPAKLMLGDKYTPERALILDRQMGLLKPLPQQFWIWFSHAAVGNFGYSYTYHEPVWSLIMQNIPNTLVLVGTSIVVAHFLSIFLGSIQGYFHDTFFDYAMTAATYFTYSMPTFWVAILLVQYLAVDLGWFPTGGIVSATANNPGLGDYLAHLALPVLTLAVVSVAGWARYLRSSMMEALVQDYVRTARAKGVAEWTVVVFHALRNSIMPLVTFVGLALPGLFGGALFTEEIFNRPGMGLLYWDAATERDFPVLLGVTMFLGALVIVGNLLADVLYALVDPRVVYG